MRAFLSILAIIALLHFANAQDKLLTTAERTDYQKTSTYAEVMDFISTLDKSSPYARLETLATSIEGRSVPLLIIANPLPENPEELANDDRIVVYIQGNIHAGEVEGKEATQMLARDVLRNPDSEILKNVIVLINPILNPDGNEKFSTKNRTRQNGPPSVGVRYNGQMLDLNRDAMKLETPEIRGVVQNVLNKWDPAISVDCHTTNGSYHEEPTTFVWQMNPNGDRNLINYMRDKMMPKVHRTLWDKYGVENIFYGEFIDRMDYSKGWISYAAEPRFLVNYIGLRNRLAILNENYVYADFKTRVNASYHLLLTILEYASKHKKEIERLIDEADKNAVATNISDSLALQYKGVATPEKITIKAIEADTVPGVKGYWRYKQSDRKVSVTVPYIADYFPSQSIKMPFAYLITIADPEIAELLKWHGIEVEQLTKTSNLLVEEFNITNVKAKQRLFQGHYQNSVEGEFVQKEKDFPGGTYVVYTARPLGKLAAYLLEAQSDDGLLKWNYFDRYLVPQWGRGFYPYPVYRLMQPAELSTK
ncbi:MAG: M14 family metallopeptidase [Bacteroidales bacterium]|nr:M14 family metallopeptidase [Bacteroidales bacterium]MCF6342800.1 M14 family metallopeptidase [Bacteroidales bacterium]